MCNTYTDRRRLCVNADAATQIKGAAGGAAPSRSDYGSTALLAELPVVTIRTVITIRSGRRRVGAVAAAVVRRVAVVLVAAARRIRRSDRRDRAEHAEHRAEHGAVAMTHAA